MNRLNVARLAGVAVLAAGLATSLTTPAAAAPQAAANVGMLQALQRDLGLSADAALARAAQENTAALAEQALTPRLGGSFGGAWFDSASGKLVVAVTDASRVNEVQAAGATAKVVQRSAAQLDAVKAAMDQKSTSAPASVTGWYVDQTTNSVVASVAGSDAAGAAWAASQGARVESVAQAPRPLWNLIGGQAIRNSQARCSIAFSARAGSTRYIITAGHCGELGGTWSGSGGTIGPVASFSFPGNDYAIIQVTSSAAVQTALVDRFSSGSDVTVAGSSQAGVGSSICRSGSTTGWHCGTIQANNQTVNYGGGDIVGGLTRTSVCAEPGDSGGAYVSPNGATRVQAQGITSGGSGNCSTGGTTFHQPVNEVLSRFGLTLVTG
ncbi:MAG TPA: S1 family peptidase [Actinophytocola sp.]|jgi:streptogrisin C|uniref:S1 family peptidase n=1 Tax=Actinophytocola sp. TaxID=1872138 RepID=UPI002DFF7A7C|nr:S1 family peptidase [Actinophytocola sp.]